MKIRDIVAVIAIVVGFAASKSIHAAEEVIISYSSRSYAFLPAHVAAWREIPTIRFSRRLARTAAPSTIPSNSPSSRVKGPWNRQADSALSGAGPDVIEGSTKGLEASLIQHFLLN